MDKLTLLLKDAKKLSPASPKTFEEFTDKKEVMGHSLNIKFLLQNDAEKLVGKSNIGMMKNNHTNHLDFMGSIFFRYNAETFVRTILWVYKTYKAHGFTEKYWPAMISAFIELYKQALTPEAAKEIIPFYRWILKHHNIIHELTEPDEATN